MHKIEVIKLPVAMEELWKKYNTSDCGYGRVTLTYVKINCCFSETNKVKNLIVF